MTSTPSTEENRREKTEEPVEAKGVIASTFQHLRLALLISFFVAGVISIAFSQLLIMIFTFYNPEMKRYMLNFTKTNFIILLTFITQLVSPCKLVLSHDGTIPLRSFQYSNILDNKILKSYLEERSIVIANHQIYIDWVYLWFFAYCNEVGNNVYIIMKESLKKIPIAGYGMTNYNFIFLSRKWEQDKSIMTRQLAKIDHYSRILKDKTKFLNLQKHWLILFPEGTNMSPDRLEKSNNWCDKVGTPRLKNILLPRVKGLYLATTTLSATTTGIYNVTLGYSGIRQDQFAQDIYTMPNIYLRGAGPKEVHIHFSRTDISDIDGFRYGESLTEQEEQVNMNNFEKWLFRKWYQKDELMDQFYKTGEFGKGEFTHYDLELKINSYLELGRIFVIPWGFCLLAYLLFTLFTS